MADRGGGAAHGRRRRLVDRVGARLERLTGIPLVGIGILVCAVAAPLQAQRAAVWSVRAGDAEQNQLQNQSLREEHFSQDLATVNQDARLFGSYAEHENTALVALDQAQAHGVSPALELSLLRSAQIERSIAAGYRQALQSAGYVRGPKYPSFEFATAVTSIIAGDPELQTTQSATDQRLARIDHDKATDYTGIATLWTAGLFFCTLAEVARRRSRARRVFAVSAALVVGAATVLTLTVWLS